MVNVSSYLKEVAMSTAVILTALPVEYLAVRAHLEKLTEFVHPQGTVYESGKFIAEKQTWKVGIVEIGAGIVGAAVETCRVISYFNPDLLFFVGIAGGIKDVKIGDVVAATKIYSYESKKVGNRDSIGIRPTLGESSHSLVQRCVAEAKKKDWLQRLPMKNDANPRVFVGPIATGDKVLSSKESDVFKLIREHYNDSIAVEMEGYGFIRSAFATPDIKAIVIRGISDLIEGKNDNSMESEEDRQEKASIHASAFAFEVLFKF